VIPIGILKGIPVDLEGVCTMVDFEVIDIVDNTTPYPTLLGLDWEFYNQDIINLKTMKMIFESREYRVIAPSDPSEGGRYVELVTNNFIIEETNQLYRITVCDEDYINPTTNGILSWISISSCASYSNIGLENWKQHLHEISTRICSRMTCTLRWIGIEVRETLSFHGLNDLEEFLTKFILEVLENQRLPVLDISLKATPTHWLGTHKENIHDSHQCKRLLCIRFGIEKENKYMEKYDGIRQPREHIDISIIQWRLVPPEEWSHHFIHTLESIPRNWYT
jgi:hypothetical protein